jgi:hypothetical protein
VVGHEVGDDRLQLGALGDDLREQARVLAAVVAAQRGAEPAAEEEEVLAGRGLELPVDGASGEVERLAQALVDGAEFIAEGDQAVGVGTDGGLLRTGTRILGRGERKAAARTAPRQARLPRERRGAGSSADGL